MTVCRQRAHLSPARPSACRGSVRRKERVVSRERFARCFRPHRIARHARGALSGGRATAGPRRMRRSVSRVVRTVAVKVRAPRRAVRREWATCTRRHWR
jgi:hypothetical protein